MVKRCSAKNCYNSQLTHKIAYFGYPKNEVVARKWAELAGRDDLADKRLENLTKYYLCSDHFSPEAFVNPNIEDKSFLRLNRTYEIPLPAIFEDNLMKNVKLVTENPEKFVNYTKHSSIEAQENLRRSSERTRRKQDVVDVSHSPTKEDEEDEELDYEYVSEGLEISRSDETESIDINIYCRLCGRNPEDLHPIFDENGEFYADTECIRLMPSGLIMKDDGLPQYSCFECLEKLQSCSSIIDGFVMNQSMFTSE